MRLGRTWLIWCGLYLGLLGACAPASTNLQRPRGMAGLDTAGLPATEAQVAEAVRQGVIRKGWAILSDEPGVIRAGLSRAGHEATVRIEYNADGWVIHHESSSPGLRYDPDYRGREIIHRRYNLWVQQLNQTIQKVLRRVRARADHAPPPPPPSPQT